MLQLFNIFLVDFVEDCINRQCWISIFTSWATEFSKWEWVKNCRYTRIFWHFLQNIENEWLYIQASAHSITKTRECQETNGVLKNKLQSHFLIALFTIMFDLFLKYSLSSHFFVMFGWNKMRHIPEDMFLRNSIHSIRINAVFGDSLFRVY